MKILTALTKVTLMRGEPNYLQEKTLETFFCFSAEFLCRVMHLVIKFPTFLGVLRKKIFTSSIRLFVVDMTLLLHLFFV